MNSKNQDHYGGDYNKRFNRATTVEIITKEISRATMVECKVIRIGKRVQPDISKA